VAVSCASDALCVAIDSAGDALASGDPGAANPTWSSTEIDLTGVPAGISCATSGLCVLVDGDGNALAGDDPTAAIPTWSGSTAEAGASLTGVACLPAGLCMALDTGGQAVRALVAAPIFTSTAAVEVGSTEATLTGMVDPNDGAGECRVEYGPSATYGQSIACAGSPSPSGGAQAVSARVAGLTPASGYHFRIVASNAGGTGVSADATLTTAAAVRIVHPSPSIAGVPDVGERLRCNPGVPSDAPATVTYAWVRDTSTIAGATSSSYVVKTADAEHHLQCRVTATDSAGSATAGSPFVAVPAAGVLAAVGETKVGKVSASGAVIGVPVTCSSHASAGCVIKVRVTITQTRPGRANDARSCSSWTRPAAGCSLASAG
jgi:hypothetical protein